jgi:hypothetical protein
MTYWHKPMLSTDNEIVLPHATYDEQRECAIILRKNPEWDDIIEAIAVIHGLQQKLNCVIERRRALLTREMNYSVFMTQLGKTLDHLQWIQTLVRNVPEHALLVKDIDYYAESDKNKVY